MPEERVQKILAQAGYGSRRGCEKIIEAGRVTVNGKRIKLGDKADSRTDEIRLDGALINKPEEKVYIALYKPRGVLSSTKPQAGIKTVIDLVPNAERLFPVGRLDLESEGLIFLTNDGDLANRLTHPRYEKEKEYRVLLARHPDRQQIETWRRGVVLEDGHRTKPAQVTFDKPHGKGAWIKVILTEGRKRQIREVASQLGLPVAKLIRVRIGTLRIGSLKPRDWRNLDKKEVQALKGEPSPQKKRSPKKRRK